jgi:hypothetical protein
VARDDAQAQDIRKTARIPAQREFGEGDLVRARPVRFEDDPSPEAAWVTGRLRTVGADAEDPWSFDLVWISDGTGDEPVVVDSSTLQHVPPRIHNQR